MKKRMLVPVLAVAGAIGISVALAATQVINFNPGAQRSLAAGTFGVVACNQNVGGGPCMAANAGIDHTFVSLTPAVCTVAETVPPVNTLSTADVTPLTTGTCALRVISSGTYNTSTMRLVSVVP